MSSGAGLPELSAREAARRIRTGALSAETYASALIARAEQMRPLNSLISFDPQLVLTQARRLDAERAAGRALGALAGLPFVVKDQLETAFYPTTAGTAGLRDYRARRNAPVVQGLLDADAVLFATANLHELASGGTSNNAVFGAVRNPYDRARIPGGSSGGTAAALAARIAPLGLGEDTGGSVRIPAGFCGIAGLRPTSWPRKIYPDEGLAPPAEPDDLQTVGPMAREVADLGLLHSVIVGEPAAPPADLAGMRLGTPDEAFWSQPLLDPTVADLARAALARLAEAGAELVPIDMELVRALGTRLAPVVSPGDRGLFRSWLRQRLPDLAYERFVEQIGGRDVRARYEADAPHPSRSLTSEQRFAAREEANRVYERLLLDDGLTALAFPNPLILPPPIAEDGDPVSPQVALRGREWPLADVALRYMTFGSRLGAPGLTLPIGLAEGLPVGLELAARPGDDAVLIGLGMAIELALGPCPPPPL